MSLDYQKLLAYPPEKSDKGGSYLVNLVQGLCHVTFAELENLREPMKSMSKMIEEAIHKSGVPYDQVPALGGVTSRIQQNYHAMAKFLKGHSNGPLMKVIDLMEYGSQREFDPLLQHNIPNHWFDVHVGEHKMSCRRIASPTKQEFIDKAQVSDEFKGFLRECAKRDKKHLIINLQDRTSWREHFRCHALEELQHHPDFADQLSVVTLACDTDFYYQLPPYQQINHADMFMEALKEQIKGENTGYYFPSKIKKMLFLEGWVEDLIKKIHHVFFYDKNVLTREQRMNFIDILHQFVAVKVMEIVRPDSFSFSCKDGIDTGGASTALFFAIMSFLQGSQLTKENVELLDMLLYTPSLLIRERVMLPERFNRFLGACKVVEHVQSVLGPEGFVKTVREEFGSYFKAPMLEARLDI